MEKEEIKKLTKELSLKDEYEKIEKILLNYLEGHPQDTEMWLRLAMLEDTTYFGDHNLIFKYMNNVLQYDPHNALAILILVYFHKRVISQITDEHFQKLQSAQTDDPKVKGLLEIAKSWYWDYKENWAEYIKCLNQSIKFDPNQVKSYFILGKIALGLKRYDEAKQFLEIGLKNIQRRFGKKYKSKPDRDYTDYNDLFDEFFRDTVINADYAEYIEGIVKQLNEGKHPKL